MFSQPNMRINIENNIRILKSDLISLLIKVMWLEVVEDIQSLKS